MPPAPRPLARWGGSRGRGSRARRPRSRRAPRRRAAGRAASPGEGGREAVAGAGGVDHLDPESARRHAPSTPVDGAAVAATGHGQDVADPPRQVGDRGDAEAGGEVGRVLLVGEDDRRPPQQRPHLGRVPAVDVPRLDVDEEGQAGRQVGERRPGVIGRTGETDDRRREGARRRVERTVASPVAGPARSRRGEDDAGRLTRGALRIRAALGPTDDRPLPVLSDQDEAASARAGLPFASERDIDPLPAQIRPEGRAVLVAREAPDEADAATETGDGGGDVAAHAAGGEGQRGRREAIVRSREARQPEDEVVVDAARDDEGRLRRNPGRLRAHGRGRGHRRPAPDAVTVPRPRPAIRRAARSGLPGAPGRRPSPAATGDRRLARGRPRGAPPGRDPASSGHR